MFQCLPTIEMLRQAIVSPSDAVKRYVITLLGDPSPIYYSKLMGCSIDWLKNQMAYLNDTLLSEFPKHAIRQITTDFSLQAVQDKDPAGHKSLVHQSGAYIICYF